MKGILIFTAAFIAAAFLLVSTVAPAAADPSLPAELDYMDAQLAVFLPRLEIYQADYIADNGIYFQALQSVAIAPDGLAQADDITSHPTDQAAALIEMWNYTGLPVELAWTVRVDTYNGPKGLGYVVTVQTRDLAGLIWEKCVAYGPEFQRGYNWFEIVPEPEE